MTRQSTMKEKETEKMRKRPEKRAFAKLTWTIDRPNQRN